MKEKATFGAGCFWSPQLTFSNTKGVLSTNVGFMGGSEQYDNPSYDQVCTGITGHAEVVHIFFDSLVVSYKKLLEIFFSIHDPTQQDRQGPDVGSQYRSVIFYHSGRQKKEAEDMLKLIQSKLDKPIVTQLKKALVFYPAEEYHQDYLKKQGQTSCGI